MILVTGATGKTGRRVLDQLVQRGESVRAQIHDVGKVDRVPVGAELVVCSFEDVDAWDAAVSGCSAIYLVSPPGPEQRRQEGVVIEAARRSGTGARIVKLAAMGLDDPKAGRIAAQHSQIRDDLSSSGLPWSIVAISQLMDNLLLYLAPVQQLGILPVPAGDAHVAWVDGDDVAAVAVSLLTTDGHEGRTVDVTGAAALHHRDVAKLLGAWCGHEVTYIDVPPEQALAAMIEGGLDPWVAAGLVETNGWYARGGAAQPTQNVRTLTGRAPTSLADFVERLPLEAPTIAEPGAARG